MRTTYSASMEGFIGQNSNAVVALLTDTSQSVILQNEPTRYTSRWRDKIEILQATLEQLKGCSSWNDWHIILEYPIPWTVHHIDAVLLARDLVFAIEIRLGADEYDPDDVALVEDFCLHLRDFHEPSRGHMALPILVGTDAPSTATHHTRREDLVQQTFLANTERLTQIIGYVVESYTNYLPPVDPDAWERVPCQATPTLPEATQALFAEEHVYEVPLAAGSHTDPTPAVSALREIVDQAREKSEKIVCFLSGRPGAGKTLSGLSFAKENGGQYLSSNTSFVDVLQRSILAKHHAGDERPIAESRRDTYSFVQDLYDFFDKYYGGSLTPECRVAVIDDAQRGRDPKGFYKRYVRHRTEAGLLLDIFGRREGWCVLLVIISDNGVLTVDETTTDCWREAAEDQYANWRIIASPELVGAGKLPFAEVPEHLRLTTDERLHCCRSVRSACGQPLCLLVDTILELKPAGAKSLIGEQFDGFPLAFTRSLKTAREWLRERRRGKQRSGFIASTGAKRILAHGLEVADRLDMGPWYMASATDVRSSSQLEIAARDRHMLGLELDWVGVCWGADMRHDSAGWQYLKFHASSWRLEDDETEQAAIRSKYRLLLTRARRGMIIWIPKGDIDDNTRLPTFYDHTAEYFRSCGIEEV